MKTIVALGCLLLIAGVARADMKEDLMETIKEYLEPCAAELNIAASEMEKFHDSDLQGEDRTKFGCLKACVMKRMNTMQDGQIVAENFRETVEKIANSPDKVMKQMEIMSKCVDENKDKTDECELAFEFSRCFMMNDTA